jgi:hypothetical protein
MSGLHDHPSMDAPQWEPEPLHLPVDDGPDDGHRRGNRNRTGGNDRERERDLPGSHVIVIDLA